MTDGNGIVLTEPILTLASNETFSTIDQWQEETFPDALFEGVLSKLRSEMDELNAACNCWAPLSDQAEEAADVVIIGIQMIRKCGLDPQAVINAKMANNRARQWNIRPDGTGQHVEEG